MVTSSPYLPYILRDVVTEVNNVFASRADDPFNVFFDYGLYVDVAKNIYKKETSGEAGIYPLIWLVDDWTYQRGSESGYYGTASCELIFAMPTDSSYTSEERTQNIFLPRLFPIYDEFLYRIGKSKKIVVQSPLRLSHTVRKRSYWGGMEAGTDTKNLFQNYIDALHIPSISLVIKTDC